MLKTHQIPVLDSNFVLIVECTETGEVAIIDAPPGDEAIQYLDAHKLTPTKLLITHHHWDHTDGMAALRDRYKLTVYGPKAEEKDIPHLDVVLEDGDVFTFGAGEFETISAPGHTYGHITYFFKSEPTLYAGDALFSLGCGRMFDGPANVMWEGLKRLRDLPDETQLYCGHEYTVSNGEFALSIDPDNQALQERVAEAKAQRAKDMPTLPTTLKIEKQANPFLRPDDPGLINTMKTQGKEAFETFAAIRAAKDKF